MHLHGGIRNANVSGICTMAHVVVLNKAQHMPFSQQAP